MRAAIDFGISNTDAVLERPDGTYVQWSQPMDGTPDVAQVTSILARASVRPGEVDTLAVTGGQHRNLPAYIDGCSVVPVGEMDAIGTGGLVLGSTRPGIALPEALVVSAGSGTAVVAARGNSAVHVTGSGVGGGTLLGLSRLLLHTTNPREIDELALAGNPHGADLSLADVVGGGIGRLPADATAVNFGRLAREERAVSRPDLAAALVTLVGQVIAVTAINAARAQQLEHIVIIGHLTDMRSICRVLTAVGTYYGAHLLIPYDAGFGTALGALQCIKDREISHGR